MPEECPLANGAAVSFVIPVRNASHTLGRCLASIREASDDHSIEILVIDNGSTDASEAVARGAGATVLDRPGLKVGALRNAGVAIAQGEIVAFVDADHEIANGWVTAALAVFDDPRVGGTGRLCDPPPRGTWVQHAYGHLRSLPPLAKDVEWLGAGNLAMRKTTLRDVGGFDETLESCEDVDLCRKVTEAGWRLVSVPGMSSIHYGDPATLGQLFYGELWRGRDNLWVSLRGAVTLRSLPGLLAPIMTLGLLLFSVVAAGASWWAGVWPFLLGLGGLAMLVLLRTTLMVKRGGARAARDLPACVAVAATYDIARALALVAPGSHSRRTATGASNA